MVIREWMKALLRPSIRSDHKSMFYLWFTLCGDLICARAEAMVSLADVSLVPLEIARTMNPRPPSPTTAAAKQRSHRRENLKQLSTHGGVTLTKMQSMPSQNDKTSVPSRAGSISSGLMTKAVLPLSPSDESKAPIRPPRDARRKGPQLEVRGSIPPFSESIPMNAFYSRSFLCCYASMRTAPVRRSGPHQVGKWQSSGHVDKR